MALRDTHDHTHASERASARAHGELQAYSAARVIINALVACAFSQTPSAFAADVVQATFAEFNAHGLVDAFPLAPSALAIDVLRAIKSYKSVMRTRHGIV